MNALSSLRLPSTVQIALSQKHPAINLKIQSMSRGKVILLKLISNYWTISGLSNGTYTGSKNLLKTLRSEEWPMKIYADAINRIPTGSTMKRTNPW